jgi:PAS domain S-box-containing protein
MPTKRPSAKAPMPKSAGNAELERQRLISLINSMGDAVIALDSSQKIVLSNAAALDILDSNKLLEGQPVSSVFKPHDENNQPVALRSVINECSTQFTTRDWKIIYSKDDSVSVFVSIAAVQLGFGEDGGSGWVVLMRDITREKSLEEERDEFISVVSHELRTPIAITEGNIGNAQFVFEKSGLDNAAIRDALKEAHDQVNFLSSMINDLATLSRAERGKLQVEIESINAHDLCETLISNYTKDAEAKGLKLHSDLNPDLEMLQSSKLYVREILQNFITNAIKYTESGSVTLHAKPVKQGVQFAVSDTGIGISKTDQERVFDKFFRSEDFHTRAQSGTGLGLYVTVKLSRLVHAEIDLESTPGKGSTFTVTVPNLR